MGRKEHLCDAHHERGARDARPRDIDGDGRPRTTRKETKVQTKFKKLLTIAAAAAAIATVSLGATGEALAKGGGGWKGGGHHNGFYHGFYFYTPVVSPCWAWYGSKRLWICS